MTETDATQPATLDRLMPIWARVLRVPDVAPDSDFFDLGGDSLLAVNMFLEIERETGIELPLTTIYDAPTAAELAAYIDMQAKPKFSPLVRFRDGVGATPLFFIHGVGGSVMELAPIGKLVAHDGPVYGLQARGLDGSEEPLRKVEDMAAYYVKAIRAIQPCGPYLVAGYSFGGLVALEMARLWKQQGERLDLLLMIDAYAHPVTWPARARLAVFSRRAWRRIWSLAHRHPSDPADLARAKAEAEVVRNTVPQGGVRRWLRQLLADLPPALQKVCLASEEALDSYVPRHFPAEIVFVKAATPSGVFPANPKPIWKSLVRKLMIYPTPGDHRSLLSDHAVTTAARISSCLPRTQGAASASRKAEDSLWLPTAAPLKTRPC